jgi:alpha-ketoglutarate-dependent taurine dioxygenase
LALPDNIRNEGVYCRWRDAKLAAYPADIDALTVTVNEPSAPAKDQITALAQICGRANMAIYKGPKKTGEDKRTPIAMGRALGLTEMERSLTTEEDGVSALEVAGGGDKATYIPYTDRRLGWHTDGCYNDDDHAINGFILHCVRAAKEGGENFLLDPEIAYIHLRDENPEFIDGLMQPNALSIPANEDGSKIIRAAHTGPALAIDPLTGALHLRYTARKTHVSWLDDARVSGALVFLEAMLSGNCSHIFRIKLQPGSGLVGNNVLHGRTKFEDGDGPDGKRLIYRIYYQDRISGPAKGAPS